jgi:asparagine synthase (glutamine-hydrolysing)
MCGITGIIGFDNTIRINETTLRSMASYLKYRGPDKEGYYINQDNHFQLALAHRRLRIIDLSEKANQPMRSHSGNSIIVFNGEIYNYRELKCLLQKEGGNFNSDSDTEVILVAYELWGINKCLKMIEGMFAFAICDLRKQELIIARDRFGEKPLYFAHINKNIAFSSDIRSFKHLNISKEIDDYALEYYFQELSTPKSNTIWKSIKKLNAGNYILFGKNELKQHQYWELNYRDKNNVTLQGAIDRCEILLKESVKRRLVSDVPVGSFLSGGIDSSLVTLFAGMQSSSKIDTFSVGFEYEKYNELPFAKVVANKIKSNHHEIILNPKDLSIVDNLIEEYGEPFADSSMIPTYYISKYASSKVKVVLGGDGGDEIFAGYGSHNQALRMQKWYNNNWLSPILEFGGGVINHHKLKYLNGVMKKDVNIISSALYRNMGFTTSELNELLMKPSNSISAMDTEHIEMIKHLDSSINIFDTILYGSIKTRMVNDYFVKTDRASMFNSLELRTPFVDTNLVEFCASIPYKYLMKNSTNKFITKKIAEKYFDHDFIYREKMGFGIPVKEWIRKDWKKEFYDVLLATQTYYPINYSLVKKMLDSHCSGKRDYTNKLWSLYVFQKWIFKNYK